jgi:hypothetical protein
METTRVDIPRQDGKPIGYVEGGVFYKRLQGSKHMLQKPPGWAYDEFSLRKAEKAGAHLLHILDTETDIIYTAPLKLFWERCFPVNRGYGAQLGLALHRWRARDPNQMEMF